MGKAKIEDVSGIGLGEINPFRYRGYYYDNDIKMYYLKTRYYDPEIGRFMTIDGISYLNPNAINGLNLYAYCGNNPVMYIDSNGTDAILVTSYYEYGFPIVGHSTLLIQDSDGTWWITEFVPTEKKSKNLLKYKKSASIYCKTLKEAGYADIDTFYDDLGPQVSVNSLFNWSGYETVRLEGDYTKALAKAKGIADGTLANSYNGKYNLLFNNCLHYVQDILRDGESNNLFTQLVHIMPSGLIPAVFSWEMKLLQTNSIGSMVVAGVTAALNPIGDTLRSIYKYIKSFI